MSVRVGHVEAGLRSRDRSMPEEINRLLTDQLSDLLFTPSSDGDQNLLREGIEPAKIHNVGNVMIDSLVRLLPRAEVYFPAEIRQPYALVTLHRPSNVDDPVWLRELLKTLSELASQLTVLFPVHPRTRRRITETTGASIEETKSESTSMASPNIRLRLLDPLPYLEFISLQRRAAVIITDSGGIQEEASFLGVPCLTVRENTERPITIAKGTNQLVGRDLARLRSSVEKILAATPSSSTMEEPSLTRIPLWDGHAADRIAEILAHLN